MAVDPDIAGNTKTSLGPLDACVATQVGSIIIADVTVDEIPADRAMIGFDVSVQYDPALFEVIAIDHNQLLGATGTYAPLVSSSDALPDTDGSVRVSLIDTAVDVMNNVNVESGPGVLYRITLRAKAAGSSDLRVHFDQAQNLYPQVRDKTNSLIQVDQIGVTKLAVGQPCPDQTEAQTVALPTLADVFPTPPPTPEGQEPFPTPRATEETGDEQDGNNGSENGGSESGEGDDDDSSALLPVVIAAGIVTGGAAAGFAGWRIFRGRKTN
jgi:hypothetical protein